MGSSIKEVGSNADTGRQRDRVKDFADVRKLVFFYYSSIFRGCSLWAMPKYKL